MSTPALFIRVTSAGEVYQGTVPPVANRGTPVAVLEPGQKIVFFASVTGGEAELFSTAASWPGNICKPYLVETLGSLGDAALRKQGFWFKKPVRGTPVPSVVKFTFDGIGLLKSESGNGTATVDLAQTARRNAQTGEIIEHSDYYVALRPKGRAKAVISFENNARNLTEMKMSLASAQQGRKRR